MPNYDDDAIEAGWVKTGSKWTHKQHPGKVFYNAREIYPLLPEYLGGKRLRRPCSATPSEAPKPAPVEPLKVEAKPEVVTDIYAPVEVHPEPVAAAPKRGRPPKA